MSVAAEAPHRLSTHVATLIAATATAAAAVLVAAAPSVVATVGARPTMLLEFVALSLLLQLFSVPVHDGGAIGVSAVGIIAIGIALGTGPAVFAAALAALVRFVVSRGVLHRAVFDAAQYVLAAAASALTWHVLQSAWHGQVGRVVAGCTAGLVYTFLNNGLLCCAIGLDSATSPLAVWRDRFRWARFHYAAFGPLAFAAAEGYRAIGLVGLAAFSLPPGLLLLSVRQYMERTKQALADERSAKNRLRAQNENLAALYAFSTGLSRHAHDRAALVAFAESELATMFGAARVTIGEAGGAGIQLVDGEEAVASLQFDPGATFDRERWELLAQGIELQLAPAIERARLVEQVWKTHLELIAALSRSMEAKDFYTGGHTERVASVAVTLAKRLGFAGPDLDALQIGALLHDIGKIGIPEAILNKPGPLDDDEWVVMKRHPLVSEYILTGVDLPPVVREVARWSHERVDGRGYPDGLAGEEIPLAAKIVLVADTFDALTSDRSYRKARPVPAAIAEIRAHTGTQFCPEVIDALERVYREEPEALGAAHLRAVATA